MENSKTQFTEPMRCGHCENKVRMKIVATYDQVQSYEDHKSGIEWQAGPIWELAICPACSNLTLRRIKWHEYFEPEELKMEILYPSAIKPLTGLPPKINEAYQAALRVRHIDSNAFAVLLRRLIDLVCLDRGANGKSLYERLAFLAEKGEIPGRLAEMTHQLRQLGNIGAHADLGDLTPAEVPILDDICRAVLEYLYTAPRLIDQVEQRIKELKKISENI